MVNVVPSEIVPLTFAKDVYVWAVLKCLSYNLDFLMKVIA